MPGPGSFYLSNLDIAQLNIKVTLDDLQILRKKAVSHMMIFMIREYISTLLTLLSLPIPVLLVTRCSLATPTAASPGPLVHPLPPNSNWPWPSRTPARLQQSHASLLTCLQVPRICKFLPFSPLTLIVENKQEFMRRSWLNDSNGINVTECGHVTSIVLYDLT